MYFAPLAKDREVASSTWRRTSCTVAAGFAARIVRKAVRVSMDRCSFFAECFNRRLAFLIHVRRRRAFKTSGEQSAGTRTPQAGTCELADEPGVSSCAWAASGLSARITVAINDALFDPHVDRNPGGGRRAITTLISLLVTCVNKKIPQPLVHGCCAAHLEQSVDQVIFPAARIGRCASEANAFSQRINCFAAKVIL